MNTDPLQDFQGMTMKTGRKAATISQYLLLSLTWIDRSDLSGALMLVSLQRKLRGC